MDNWQLITAEPIILNAEIPLLKKLLERFSPRLAEMTELEKNVQNEIDKMLGKKAIFSDQHKPEVILSLILVVSIKTEILRLVIILKKLNIMRKNIFVCFLMLITQ